MRSFPETTLSALTLRTLVARDFLWIEGRDRDTGAAVTNGLWSDVGSVSVQVMNPETNSAVTRGFEGAGALVQIGDIPAVSSLTVQEVTIDLSQIAEQTDRIVRTYDVRQAKVQIFRGYFDPATRALIDPAQCRFFGFVDKVEIVTPKEGEPGKATLTCVSHTQEMTRSNPDTRSHDSQKLRVSSDTFYQDTAATGSWEIFWGRYKRNSDPAAVLQRFFK
jgi:hypothetical protein